MLFASLILASRYLLPLAAAAFLAGFLLLVWSYRVAGRGPLAWLCLTFKLIGFAALAACLLEPLWSGQHARPGANLFAIVADNSQGLQIKDRGSQHTRGEELRELLNPQRLNWQGVLEENFDVRRYFFDARLQSL